MSVVIVVYLVFSHDQADVEKSLLVMSEKCIMTSLFVSCLVELYIPLRAFLILVVIMLERMLAYTEKFLTQIVEFIVDGEPQCSFELYSIINYYVY